MIPSFFITPLVCHPFRIASNYHSDSIFIIIDFPIFFQLPVSGMYFYSFIDFVLKDKIPGIKLSFYTSFTGYGTNNLQGIAFSRSKTDGAARIIYLYIRIISAIGSHIVSGNPCICLRQNNGTIFQRIYLIWNNTVQTHINSRRVCS